jgi:hypothetical protein
MILDKILLQVSAGAAVSSQDLSAEDFQVHMAVGRIQCLAAYCTENISLYIISENNCIKGFIVIFCTCIMYFDQIHSSILLTLCFPPTRFKITFF